MPPPLLCESDRARERPIRISATSPDQRARPEPAGAQEAFVQSKPWLRPSELHAASDGHRLSFAGKIAVSERTRLDTATRQSWRRRVGPGERKQARAVVVEPDGFRRPRRLRRRRQGAESERPVGRDRAPRRPARRRLAASSSYELYLEDPRLGLRFLCVRPHPACRWGPALPMYVASGHRGGGDCVSGLGASRSLLAAGGGSAVSGVGAAGSVLAAGGGVGRARDPRPARVVVELRGGRLGFAVPAFCVSAAVAFVLRRVLVRAREVVAFLSPLEPDAGVAAGSRRSISSATARSSETAARAARWACLPAVPLTPLSAFAACLRRPTCRRRSKRSASFLAMIVLLALPKITRSQPYRDGAVAQRRSLRTRRPAGTRSSYAAHGLCKLRVGGASRQRSELRRMHLPGGLLQIRAARASARKDASAAAASDDRYGIPPVPPSDDCLGDQTHLPGPEGACSSAQARCRPGCDARSP